MIAATFTAEPLEEPLRLWLSDLGCNANILFAPHNQVTQQLLDTAGLFADNRSSINTILLRLEDWAGGSKTDLHRAVDEFVTALKSAARRSAAPYFVFVCPSSAAFDQQVHLSTIQARRWLRYRFRDVPCLRVMSGPDRDDAEVRASSELGHSSHGDIPYTPLFFGAIATCVARAIHALFARPVKVLALDADNTLWDGECATDDLGILRIGASHRALHDFALKQRAQGVLLCLVSKNAEADVLRAIDHHPDSLLRREHFAAWRINWGAKSDNLRSLAQELGFGAESFLVFDDSEVECAEIQARCPSTIVLTLPREPDRMQPFLQQIWALDRLSVTDADRERADGFAVEQDRRRLRENAPSLVEFVASLQVNVVMRRLSAAHVARAAQLTERTNQFNTSGARKTGTEIAVLSETPDARCFVVEVSDRLGDYGIVGAAFTRIAHDVLRIETLVLSCRALGRGVEHQVVSCLGRVATELGLDSIEFLAARTGRNQPALDFLARIASTASSTDTELRFRLEARRAVSLRFADDQAFRTRALAREAHSESASVERDTSWSRPMLGSRLANEIAHGLHTPRQRLHRAYSSGLRPRRLATAAAPPRTDLEKVLAEAWARHARVSDVGIGDDFFELGGTSLQATMLVNEIQRRAGHSFPGVVVFQCPTVASLAQYLESHDPDAARVLGLSGSVHQPSQNPLSLPDERTVAKQAGRLLEDLDGLSDADVSRLLAALDNAPGPEDSP